MTQEAQTITEVLARLEKDGFTKDFRASECGLKIITDEIEVSPEDLVVEKIYRFEGETDLDEEAMIFALYSPQHKIKGTYLVAFGPKMDSIDSSIVQRLERRLKK